MKSGSFVAFAKSHWLAFAILGLSSAVAILFAGRFVLALIYFNDPRHQDEALKAWMTPRYVLMSYDLPREVVADVLGLADGGPGRLRLDEIAERLGLSLDELTDRVREAAAAHRDRPL